MSDKNNNGSHDEQSSRSTDSNLPILFANGYPTSLEKMSRDQLELFIPFLVKCSRDGSDEDETTAPKWWPDLVQFRVPLEKPKSFQKDWEKTLRKVVEICYEYHKQPFLLKYSRDLCDNEPANLRYVKASESTTSLYSRRPKKLLLTFRNENMFYDKKKRMTLWKKDDSPSPELDQDEIESTFDIMLCDYCDAEFYSDEAFTKHEKKCGNQTEQELPIVDNIIISDDDDDDQVEEIPDEEIGGQNDFMAYLFLKSATSSEVPRRNNSMIERSLSPKKKRPQARARQNATTRERLRKEKELERSVPFSSPAGIFFTRKSVVGELYLKESLEEIEKGCMARPTTKIPPRPKHRQLTGPANAVIKDMRKPRNYSWPKRHLYSMSSHPNYEFLNRTLISEMIPCSVGVKMMSKEEIKAEQENFRQTREEKLRALAANCVDLCSDSDDDDASIILDNGARNIAPTVVDSTRFQGEFLSMVSRVPYQGLNLPQMIPPFVMHSPSLPLKNELFVSHRYNSIQTSSSSQVLHQYDLSSSEPSTSVTITASKQSREISEPDQKRTKRSSVQQWIQNINNGEIFNITNQVTVMNVTN